MFLRSTVPASIEFKVALDPGVPNVLADATQIHQIMMNLGTNAWHAMKAGNGQLDVRLERIEVDAELAESHLHVRPGSYVRISVGDTGTGMDSATVSRIFEPFFTTKAPGEGTGLGLSVVHGIIRAHDGAITVYSHLGKGTKFHLYFPAHGIEKLETQMSDAPIPRGRGERILIVDDEEPIAVLAQRMLAKLGYAAETRTSVLDALETIRSAPDTFDLVITDMTMPSMSGIDFARQLAQIRPSLPVILTTGYRGSLTLEQVRAAGIRGLLPKPPSMRSIGRVVALALAGK